MSGLPTSAGNSPLKGNVLENFEKMDAKVDPQNVEACYQLKSSNTSKRVIIKLSKRKDAYKIYGRSKKELKLLKFQSLRINNPIFINGTKWTYYKKIWAVC